MRKAEVQLQNSGGPCRSPNVHCVLRFASVWGVLSQARNRFIPTVEIHNKERPCDHDSSSSHC